MHFVKVEKITYKVIDLSEIKTGKELENKLNELVALEFNPIPQNNNPLLGRYFIFCKVEMPKVDGEELNINPYPPIENPVSETFDKLNNLITRMEKRFD